MIMKLTTTVTILLLLCTALLYADTADTPLEKIDKEETMDIMNIPFETITGEKTSLADFKGNVILIVNTASKCGFTTQYEGLEKLYKKHKDDGLVIIGFPANNFMKQEPGTNEEIMEFCRVNYGVTFPMMSKISVKGKDKHPLYVELTENSHLPGAIKWNFGKFLLDHEGNLVERFGSRTKPDSKKLVSLIEKLLEKRNK